MKRVQNWRDYLDNDDPSYREKIKPRRKKFKEEETDYDTKNKKKSGKRK
tara:strand:+ start:1467 stop:1613 length:147 start_codon:yes stop_codon:yes gene_type:complete